MRKHIDSGHKEIRTILRFVGPLVVGIGILFTAIGIGSFFAAFNSFESPQYFWCAFVGLPLVGLGIMICQFAFMGAVTRYMANEVAPVGKDVVNYMADGTKDAIRDVSAAIGDGIASSRNKDEPIFVRCHKCNELNETSANYCKNCGSPLGKTKTCPKCGELNDPDARFCDNCGETLA